MHAGWLDVKGEPSGGRFNDQLPLVLGPRPLLSFLGTHTVAGVYVIYKPLTWDVSECITLVEAQGMNLGEALLEIRDFEAGRTSEQREIRT